MDPFRLCLVLGPLVIYSFLLGAINLSRQAFQVGGTRDMGALGLAVSGLILVGPIELFFPEAAAIRFGAAVWLLLLALYLIILVLVLLWLRPRLVIYNITLDKLRPILAELVPNLDREARWAGDSLSMPTLGVQLTMDTARLTRNVSLVSAGPSQDHAGWRKLENALGEALRTRKVGRNPAGWLMFLAGTAMLVVVAWSVAHDPAGVKQAMFDMLSF